MNNKLIHLIVYKTAPFVVYFLRKHHHVRKIVNLKQVQFCKKHHISFHATKLTEAEIIVFKERVKRLSRNLISFISFDLSVSQ